MKSVYSLAVALFLVIPNGHASGIPTLSFPEGFTWKGIFDSGFRPKFIPGRLKLRSCQIIETPVMFEYGELPPFPLDKGLVTFDLLPEDRLRMFWHQSRVPISIEEGERRLELFRTMFKGKMFKDGRMPPVVDRATGTLDFDTSNDAISRVGDFAISLGFNSSFQAETPLIPNFYVSYRGADKRDMPVRREELTPPEGYEWYSLDPKIDAPDPGTLKAYAGGGITEGTAAGTRPERRPVQDTEEVPDESPRSSIGMWVALLTLGIAAFAWWLGVRKNLRR